MSLILIIDDVAAMRDQYAYDLKRLGGFETLTAGGGAEGLKLLETEPVDGVILDLEMPGVDGFEVLSTLRRKGSRLPVIVYTGTGSYERCVRAVKLGAYSFLAKDEPLERVVQQVENALAWAGLQGEVRRLRRQTGAAGKFLGESRAAVALRDQLDRLAAIPSAVLVLGESGSGKELAAHHLHDRGPRAKAPFVPVNCAALPETMVESELFGHERGAFTGADKARKGAFETAHRGTLFLDEVGELPLPAQAKLLRVLEDGVVTRLGSHQGNRVDTRVVAATTRTSTRRVREPPSGRISRSWSARSSFAWKGPEVSPPSSRKRVPPWASSKSPVRSRSAPVKAPRAWPKSSLSSSVSGKAAQLIATKALPRRGLAR